MTSFRAYAKINLGLFILAKRKDGYHTIETVFHRVDLFDEISLAPSSEITVESSSREAPGGEENICFKAAKMLQEHFPIATGAKITIQKEIPVGAGLGGGSSDAAAILLHLPKFWGIAVAEQQLLSLALQLGSDVPYFIRSGSAHARGRGEILEDIPLDIPYFILLCNPGIHVSTAWAYQRVSPRKRAVNLAILVQKGMRDPKDLLGIENDFESTVVDEYPVVGEVKQTMIENGAVFSLMSGSGSTVYGLYNDLTLVHRTSRALEVRGFKTHLTLPHFKPIEHEPG